MMYLLGLLNGISLGVFAACAWAAWCDYREEQRDRRERSDDAYAVAHKLPIVWWPR